MAACRQVGFDVTGNSAIWSADAVNPTTETKQHELPNMNCTGSPVAEIWPFAWGLWNPHSGSAMAPFERAMVVSYRLSIVTVALSVTIRPWFVIECLWRSNQQGVGHFGPKFRSIPIGVDPWCLGLHESEHPMLTSREIISEEFQPMWSQSTNVTDRRTDRQTTCDPKTALCTLVHHAVKSLQWGSTLPRREWVCSAVEGKGEGWALWTNNFDQIPPVTEN